MSTSRGYYSLIQYCPDAGRAEAANVGVLLFCPEKDYLNAKVSAENDRVRRFFKGREVDLVRLNAVKRAIVRRLQVERDRFRTPQDLEQFIATRANEIRPTASRPMNVLQPDDELRALFQELVGGRSLRRARRPLIPELDQALRQPSMTGRVRLDQAVQVPVLGNTLKIPYAYNNGTLNLVKPYVFSSDESRSTNSAAKLAVEGDLLQNHPDPQAGERRLIVVAKFDAKLNGVAGRILRLFQEYKLRTFTSGQVAELIQEIRTHAQTTRH